MQDETPPAHEVELWQDLDGSINLLVEYLATDMRYLRNQSVEIILNLLRNYRREKFGNTLTDKERGAR